MERSDEELAGAAGAGDSAAFDELMRRHERLVYRVVWSIAREREEALDLTQAVFLKAWRSLAGFRGDASLKTWLLRIARNEALNRAYRRAPLDLAGELAADAPALTRPAEQESALLEREQRGRLHRGLARLHERYRSAIELRYLHRLSIREIAGVLETSEAMAKNLLFRGVRQLRRAVEEGA